MSADKLIGLATIVGAAVASAFNYKTNRDMEMELRERITRLESEVMHLREKLEEALTTTTETPPSDKEECESTSQT